MRLIDLDDDAHCFTGNCGDYENWNIDPGIPSIDAIPIEWIKQWVEDDDSAMKFYIHLMILSWRMRGSENE